jgi:BirA family biotin operon repressor/biotin-[acetyl-CoA-carboxylase] ligase
VEFSERGFAAFADEWRAADALRDQPVRIEQGSGSVSGIARGIDPDGALLVDTGAGRERFISGEVSLRPAA